MSDLSKLAIEQLISEAGNSNYTEAQNLWSHPLALANAKMGIENNALIKRTHELTEEQIEVSSRANELTEKLLLSNEEASKQGERNAELMYKATEQLAKSTRSLNWATWVLVIFTAVQAFIAIAAFLRK
jgi:hypothetical protein